jgi:hypothetical protein
MFRLTENVRAAPQLLHEHSGETTMNQLSRRDALKGLAAASLLEINVPRTLVQAQANEMVYLRHEFSGDTWSLATFTRLR